MVHRLGPGLESAIQAHRSQRPARSVFALCPRALSGTMASATATAELKFLFEKDRVDPAISNKLEEAGITTIRQFAVLTANAEELREMLGTDFGLDPKTLEGKVKISNVLCAFNSAKARALEADRADAEAATRNVPKQVPVNDYNTMRKTFTTKYWKLSDSKAPGQTYVESQLEKLEKGDFRAEKLTEAIAWKEDSRDGLLPVWDKSGTIKTMKTKSTCDLPRNSEELRNRMAVLGASWVFASFQQTANKVLENLTPQVFVHYIDHLMGDEVWGLTSKGPDGAEVGGPSWALLLSYEQEISENVASLIMDEGSTYAEALVKSYKDKDLKDRYFLTPLKLGATKRGPQTTGGGPQTDQTHQAKKQRTNLNQNQPKGSGKGGKGGKTGKGRGKGGGKGKKAPPSDCARSTPEGKGICYAFNTQGKGCSKGARCPFEHVCGVCFKAGTPMYSCSH